MTNPSPHFHGHRQRLRARFERAGLDGFADYEVVELLLTLAVPRSDVKQPAKALIGKFGSLRGILDAPLADLRTVPGVGSVTPVALRIIREAANLYLRQVAEDREFLGSHDALAKFWRAKIGALPKEVFEVAYLDTAYRLLRNGVERKEDGTIDRAAIFPREIIEAALKRQAAAVVVAHNHPNGVLRPSDGDKLLTRALVLAGDTVNLKVLDHLIVSPDGVFSFRQEGLL